MLETTFNLTRRGLLRYGLSAGLLLPTLPCVSHAQGSGKFYAIIVGVSEYESGYQTLIAGHDATRLAGALRGLGYEQPKLVSGFVKKQELLDRLKVLLKTINPADTLLFFFGGHGSRRPLVDSNGDVVRDAIGNVREEEYLLFSDTKDDDKEFIKTALSMSELEVLMQKCVARQRIFIFDACRTTSIPERKSRDQKTGFEGSDAAVKASFMKYQARLDAIARAKPKDFVDPVQAAVLWSCSPGERSYEPKEESADATGVFTERVLLALQGGLSGIPTAGTLRDFIRSRMPSDLPGPQTPDLRGEINVTLSPIPLVARRPNPEPRPNPDPNPRPDPSPRRGSRLTDYPLLRAYVESLRPIPAGTFQMGRSDGDPHERPVHSVTLSAFRMGATPVTVAVWQEYCAATGTALPRSPAWGLLDDHPVVYVSWNDIMGLDGKGGFCAWASDIAGFRLTLPTEAQFEYASRGGKVDLNYPWGFVFDNNQLWCSKSSKRKSTAPVIRSNNIFWNAYGLTDMSGNVWQWCSDIIGPYSSNSQNDPTGPSSSSENGRCVRGGSWASVLADDFNCARRLGFIADDWYSSGGFRLSAGPG